LFGESELVWIIRSSKYGEEIAFTGKSLNVISMMVERIEWEIISPIEKTIDRRVNIRKV